jgi:electron transfer flavoprotein alpha/beta subunit
MRIAVLVKIIKKLNFKDGMLNQEKVINPYDLRGIIVAYLLIRKFGGETFVISICEEKEDIEILKQVYEWGVDNLIVAHDALFKDLDTIAKSKLISAIIKKVPKSLDIILFSQYSPDDTDGILSLFVAEKLNLPHLYGVRRFWVEDSKVVSETFTNNEIIYNEVRMPVVVALEPIITDFSKYKFTISSKKSLLIWDSKFLGLKPEELKPKVKLTGKRIVVEQRNAQIILGQNYKEIAAKLANIINKIR